MDPSSLAAGFLGTDAEEQTGALDEIRELRIRCQMGSEDSLDPHHGRIVAIVREILDAS